MKSWLAGGGPLSPEQIHPMGWIWERHKPFFFVFFFLALDIPNTPGNLSAEKEE